MVHRVIAVSTALQKETLWKFPLQLWKEQLCVPCLPVDHLWLCCAVPCGLFALYR